MNLLSYFAKLLGHTRLVGILYSYGINLQKMSTLLLPYMSEIKVSKYQMIINPKEDIGLYFGYQDVR